MRFRIQGAGRKATRSYAASSGNSSRSFDSIIAIFIIIFFGDFVRGDHFIHLIGQILGSVPRLWSCSADEVEHDQSEKFSVLDKREIDPLY